MSQSTKIIKRRIKSITNTKQITKAMELVAASKMRRAVNKALQTRDYAALGWDLIGRLSEIVDPSKHSLLAVREVENICIVLFTSNRGLAGGYNINISRKIVEQLKETENLKHHFGRRQPEKLDLWPSEQPKAKELKIDFITIGRKGENLVRKIKKEVIASFPDIADNPAIESIAPIAQIAIEDFKQKKYDKVILAYTDFISAINQKPRLRQLLPISAVDLEKILRQLGSAKEQKETVKEEKAGEKVDEYLFEPDPEQLLDLILSRLVEVQIFQALLEAQASEHSARMMAMRNATEAAEEMVADLTLYFNQARQAAITKEISEISAGRAALE